MLKQPMIEKLLAMRLHGMAESLKTQEQDPAARELSFLERLGLLVDQQWNWRENQALGAAAEERQAPHQRLCRGDRLPRRTRTGQERDPCAGARISLGRNARKCVRARTNGCGQEFRGVRAGTKSLPRRVLGPLHPCPGAIPRLGYGARRWQSPQSAGPA